MSNYQYIFIGMAGQGLLSGVLSHAKIITLSPGQQLTAAAIFVVIAIFSPRPRK